MFIYLLVYSFIYYFICPFTCISANLFTPLFMCLLIYSCYSVSLLRGCTSYFVNLIVCSLFLHFCIMLYITKQSTYAFNMYVDT